MKTLQVLSVFIFSLLFANSVQAQETKLAFEKSDHLLQVGFGLGASYFEGPVRIPPIQLRYEHAVSSYISIGGIIGYAASTYEYEDYYATSTSIQSKKAYIDYSYLLVGLRGNYHFETGERFDPYGGVTLGYNSISAGDASVGGDVAASMVLYGAQIGANYYLSKNMAAWAEVGYGISYLNLGITFKF